MAEADNQATPVNTSPHVEFITRSDGVEFAKAKFVWDLEKEQAAADIAEGVYSLTEIAARAKVHVGALAAWRKSPEFIERVNEHRKVYREAVMGYGIAQAVTR